MYGPIAITPIPRALHSVVTSSPGFGRETHKMMLDHYQQTKNLLVSYSPKAWASSETRPMPE